MRYFSSTSRTITLHITQDYYLSDAQSARLAAAICDVLQIDSQERLRLNVRGLDDYALSVGDIVQRAFSHGWPVDNDSLAAFETKAQDGLYSDEWIPVDLMEQHCRFLSLRLTPRELGVLQDLIKFVQLDASIPKRERSFVMANLNEGFCLVVTRRVNWKEDSGLSVVTERSN